jgi:hypothetical protein
MIKKLASAAKFLFPVIFLFSTQNTEGPAKNNVFFYSENEIRDKKRERNPHVLLTVFSGSRSVRNKSIRMSDEQKLS